MRDKKEVQTCLKYIPQFIKAKSLNQIKYLSLIISGDSEQSVASTSISETNSCNISIRKFVSFDNLCITSISKPDLPEDAKKDSTVITLRRSIKSWDHIH